MKRPFASRRPIGPLYSMGSLKRQTICKRLQSSDRAIFALEEIIDVTRDTEKEAAVFLYKESGGKWFKTNYVVGKESEISNEVTSDILVEVPDDADEIVLIHTHPHGLAELSPQDIGLFIEFIDFLDASLVLSDYQDTVTLSGLEKTKSTKEIINKHDMSSVQYELLEIIEEVADGEMHPKEAKDRSVQLVENEGVARSCSTIIENI